MNNPNPPPGTYEELVQTLTELVGPLNDLHRQKAAAFAPQVYQIIQSRSRDTNIIEHALDHLLDCACIPDGLSLFKALCRHYYGINPRATASYVHAYREIWVGEEPPQKEAAT